MLSPPPVLGASEWVGLRRLPARARGASKPHAWGGARGHVRVLLRAAGCWRAWCAGSGAAAMRSRGGKAARASTLRGALPAKLLVNHATPTGSRFTGTRTTAYTCKTAHASCSRTTHAAPAAATPHTGCISRHWQYNIMASLPGLHGHSLYLFTSRCRFFFCCNVVPTRALCCPVPLWWCCVLLSVYGSVAELDRCSAKQPRKLRFISSETDLCLAELTR